MVTWSPSPSRYGSPVDASNSLMTSAGLNGRGGAGTGNPGPDRASVLEQAAIIARMEDRMRTGPRTRALKRGGAPASIFTQRISLFRMVNGGRGSAALRQANGPSEWAIRHQASPFSQGRNPTGRACPASGDPASGRRRPNGTLPGQVPY